jgi:flagellar biogenesis protein FliO
MGNIGFQELILMLLSLITIAAIVVFSVVFIVKKLTQRNTTDRKIDILERRINELEKR